MNHFDIKKKIVEAGNSKIFNNWHEHTGLSKEDFLAGLAWLCEDPRDEKGRLTRELGCKKGVLHKLRRCHEKVGYDEYIATIRYEDGRLWDKQSGVSISADDNI